MPGPTYSDLIGLGCDQGTEIKKNLCRWFLWAAKLKTHCLNYWDFWEIGWAADNKMKRATDNWWLLKSTFYYLQVIVIMAFYTFVFQGCIHGYFLNTSEMKGSFLTPVYYI